MVCGDNVKAIAVVDNRDVVVDATEVEGVVADDVVTYEGVLAVAVVLEADEARGEAPRPARQKPFRNGIACSVFAVEAAEGHEDP